MSLDTSTLYLVATMVAALLGTMLLFFGKQENIPALKWWGTAYLLGAASVAIWTLASTRLGTIPSLALNAVGFVACGMVWNASRVFHGRKPNMPGLVLGAIAWYPSDRRRRCLFPSMVRRLGCRSTRSSSPRHGRVDLLPSGQCRECTSLA